MEVVQNNMVVAILGKGTFVCRINSDLKTGSEVAQLLFDPYSHGHCLVFCFYGDFTPTNKTNIGN